MLKRDIAPRLTLALIALVAWLVPAGAVESRHQFVNDRPWPDNQGLPINAHGGGVLFHEGVYYWFGEHKVGGSLGNSAQVGVHCYRSTDLYNWTDAGMALAVSEDPTSEIVKGCIIERPKVIFNAATKTFVMWFHLELLGKGYSAARAGIAISQRPEGPYRYLRSLRPHAGVWPLNAGENTDAPGLKSDFVAGQMVRDMTLFADDDGVAYLIAASEDNATLHISRLNADYRDVSQTYVRVLPGALREAPAVCKYRGRYWLITSACTSWAPNAASVAVADSILGEYKVLGNPCEGINPHNGLGPEKTFGGQSTFILPVQGKPDAFIAMFDIWEPDDAIKGRYVWLPITFGPDCVTISWRETWDLSWFNGSTQFSIPRVDQMPDLPQPYRMRDWRKVTADYLNLVLDFDRKGKSLPLVSWKDSSHTMVGLPSYVGSRGGPEAINFLAAVVSGGLVNLDMRNFHGQDWVAMCTNYFAPDQKVCGNNPGKGNGGSFWYDLFPNVLFYQVCALNPGDSAREAMLRNIADQWYAGCLALGARTNASALPDFDHTSFNLRAMTPIDNGHWIEPDGAAGVAWCEYMAWAQFKDPRYLTAADWATRALEQRPVGKNPLYEVLLPYGALIAARMNAELGQHYDVARLLNWCFEPMDRPAARPGWGVIADRFGNYDCHGLAGSATDTEGYAFAMNTFEWAGALVPIARYDPRCARALGKWLLNLANASRLFYANGLPAEQQDHRKWADAYDTNYCIAYEGLRRHPLGNQDTLLQPYATGDAYRPGSDSLNLCLYGSSHVGILGSLISRTSEDTILQIDLLRTDYFHAPAYPTFLFYNPSSATKTFEANFGSKLGDLYDAVSDQVVHRRVRGKTRLSLAGNTAAVIVAVPAGAKLAREGRRVLVDGIVAKWQ